MPRRNEPRGRVRWAGGALAPRLTLVALLGLAVAPAAPHAQDAPPSGWLRAHDSNGASTVAGPAWFAAWSPLRPSIDLARGLVRAPLGPGLLAGPAPRAGAFGVAGAPGAMARDLRLGVPRDSAGWSELRVQRAAESGAFRRPLDVADATVTQGTGQGWAPVGQRGVAVGRFVVDRESHDAAGYAQRVAPHWSSPFIVTDSTTPPTRRTRVRLEGALGTELAGFGVGVAAGLESREHSSVNAPLRRSGRAATPALVAGIERVLPWAGARVGGFHKWSQANETNVLNAAPLPTILYQLRGYDEPFGFLVTESTPVFVRNDRRSTVTGGTLEATVRGTRLVAVHETGRRAEDQYQNFVSRVRPTERWRATGSTTLVQLSRPLGGVARALLVGARQVVTGTASRADLTGVAMDGRDEQLALEGDLRVTRGPWRAGVLGGVQQWRHARFDYVVVRRTALTLTTPFVGGELARSARRAAVAVGASVALRGASGGIPPLPGTDQPTYRRLLQPELAYEAARSQTVAGWLSAQLPVADQLLVLSARAERATPRDDGAARLQPTGARTVWSVGVGWQRGRAGR
ncbi:MAG: hypothetical protein RLZ32_2126 [Gemmatimonadota bacterium]